MDSIFLRAFRTKTLIGIYDWERAAQQLVEIDLDIGLPDSKAANSDNISDTISYESITNRMRELLNAQSFFLIETLAEFIAKIILNEFKSPWVKVSVSKVGILPDVDKVGICIERSKSH